MFFLSYSSRCVFNLNPRLCDNECRLYSSTTPQQLGGGVGAIVIAFWCTPQLCRGHRTLTQSTCTRSAFVFISINSVIVCPGTSPFIVRFFDLQGGPKVIVMLVYFEISRYFSLTLYVFNILFHIEPLLTRTFKYIFLIFNLIFIKINLLHI